MQDYNQLQSKDAPVLSINEWHSNPMICYEKLNNESTSLKRLCALPHSHIEHEGDRYHMLNLTDHQLYIILTNINEEAYSTQFKVRYYVNRANSLCFESENMANKRTTTRVIGDDALKPLVEEIFRIRFTSNKQKLKRINRTAFEHLLESKLPKDSNTVLCPSIQYSRSVQRISIGVQTMDTFLDSVNHINFVLQASSGFSWLSQGYPREGVLYKHFSTKGLDTFELLMFTNQADDYISKYSVALKMGEQLQDQLIPFFQNIGSAENNALWNALNTFVRKPKLKNLLASL